MTTLYNTNPRSAYRGGYFTGTHSMRRLLEHGDFGLGGLDRNDGELVVLDGRAYRTAEDGTTHELASEATTPFGTVLPFRASTGFTLDEPLTKDAFEQRLAAELPLTNRMWALRIHGTFVHVTAGASGPQTRPYRPLPDVMPEYNRIRHERTTGTLVAFHSPDYLLGIDYLGAHYHWLSDDHRQGGHVFDFETTQVEVGAAEARSFTVDVAADEDFWSLDLTPVQ